MYSLTSITAEDVTSLERITAEDVTSLDYR